MSKANTVWIVDDDRSIRWVLEKALNQAGIRTQVFDSAESISQELASGQPDAVISDIRMPGIDGLRIAGAPRQRFSRHAGDHHHGAFGSRQRRGFVSGRSIRISAEALRYRRGCRSHQARARARARTRHSCPNPNHRQHAGNHRRSACDAGSVSRHRAPVALQYHRADQRRIGYRQRAGGARAASPQSAFEQTVYRARTWPPFRAI